MVYMYVRTYVCMYIAISDYIVSATASPPRRSTIFFLSAEKISPTRAPLAPSRWMLEIVRSSVSRRLLLILAADSSTELLSRRAYKPRNSIGRVYSGRGDLRGMVFEGYYGSSTRFGCNSGYWHNEKVLGSTWVFFFAKVTPK